MTKLPVLAFALALGASAPNGAMADQPGLDWMPMERVKTKLMASGYSSITKIEADDGHWDGEGIKDGQKMKFELDPKTGEILGEAPQ
ncbi:PepSY domain-containing protein [Methylorubrum extorquens]|uniref:PepSY domain-containing protein n=1 Tax=Methylorubrum extorquens TaxID=408 RepID=UPI0022382CC4|nr:PepSY domain-containing protein [Methylorubrum extorquens]UYW28257.1 PepSY domain-containing protein [Methylorubrum extorquens]